MTSRFASAGSAGHLVARSSADRGASGTTAAPGSVQPAPSAPAPARLDLHAVVDRVQKRYDAAADFRAHFSQTLTNPTFKRKTALSGEVLLKKPGKMRWNYQTPDVKMYLADGSRLWLYEPEDQQAFKQDLKSSQLPAALAFLTGKGKLADEFEISLSKQARRRDGARLRPGAASTPGAAPGQGADLRRRSGELPGAREPARRRSGQRQRHALLGHQDQRRCARRHVSLVAARGHAGDRRRQAGQVGGRGGCGTLPGSRIK